MVVLSEIVKGSSTSSTDGHRYDVFLSFRGLDTRLNFTNHLHKALMDVNITTFLDDEEIDTGEDLKPELESAIKASRASIIVLSKNFATSTWCLDELVLILEQRMTSNHIVIPIFYHVEPTHVRNQQSCFGDAMAMYKQMMEAETNADKRSRWARKMDRWNKALKEVADLKGKDINGRLETEFIEEIVEDIYRRLHVPIRSHLPLLIGMEASIEFITSWLEDTSSHTTDILTIIGMGGIGKTALAKYVYGLHGHKFHTSSYIADISRSCANKYNGLIDLQKQLCSDVSKICSVHVHDVSTYTSKIENVVVHKKVFLVLDDVDSLNQLDALLGRKRFHPGSKIIITTRDAWLVESCALFKTDVKPKHVKRFLYGLYETESTQLLCFHAFMSKDPELGYEDLSQKLVEYCEGHPLAIEVLGKSLYNRDVAYWEEFIEGLRKETSSHIHNVLRMSFDSLSSKNDKELFKHIACFFVGVDKDFAEVILKGCGIKTRSGITYLIDRCLLNIGHNNELIMHQLLQDMGRYVVHQESPDKPWERSRLWFHDESFKVLKQKKGTENVLGLTLDMRMLEKGRSFELKTDSLSKMDNLMLLQLNYVQISGSWEKFPEELRWLCMQGFPLKSMPSDLPMEYLVVLDMSYSNIESFGIYYGNLLGHEGKQKLLGSLKILNLSFCEQLCSLGGFAELPALERLILRNCIVLSEVCESIGRCVELNLIDMSNCKKLETLPSTIHMLKKLKTLCLDGCSLGESRIEIRDTDLQETLKVTSTQTSSSIVKEAISSDWKFFVISLPSSLVRLSLANNNLCSEIFPTDMSYLSMLKELCLDSNPIVSLPNCVRSIRRLEILSMSDCNFLTSVDHPPPSLRELILDDYAPKPMLRKIVFHPEMSPLKLSIISFQLAFSSFEIEGLLKIQPMTDIEENLLHSLGWSKLDCPNKRLVQTYYECRGS